MEVGHLLVLGLGGVVGFVFYSTIFLALMSIRLDNYSSLVLEPHFSVS